MTFSLSCQEEPLATGVASTPALVLRRATPVPDLVDPALLPAGDASLFVAVSSILHPIQKRHCLIQGPRLEGRRKSFTRTPPTVSLALGANRKGKGRVKYVCMYVFIKLHITTQSGLVILVILCHSH